MPTYKISYLVPNSKHPGGIVNLETRPQKGSFIEIGEERYQVQEVIELLPPKGKFHYLHVTCNPVSHME
ncbi:MAG: hypothetical protein R6U57_11065 [Anaerolineales bacterium]